MLSKLVFLLLPVLLSAQQARIFTGLPTERSSRPFQVALYSRVGTAGELGFCGGALIHTRWVLTAAHCCFHNGQQVNTVQAILGAYSLYDRYENGRRMINVDQIEVHPSFNPATFSGDIALLRLTSAAQITDTINVVRLPYRSITEYSLAGLGGTVSGWGIAAPEVTFVSPTLRSKLLTVMTDQLCRINYQQLLPDNVVCGFNTTGGTCRGDNGGPLTLFWNQTEETVLIGIASFVQSQGCNVSLPSVFTRIQRYLDWISQITGIFID